MSRPPLPPRWNSSSQPGYNSSHGTEFQYQQQPPSVPLASKPRYTSPRPPLPSRKASQGPSQVSSDYLSHVDTMQDLRQRFDDLHTNDGLEAHNDAPDMSGNRPRLNGHRRHSSLHKTWSGIEHPPHLDLSPRSNFYTTSSPPSCLPGDQAKRYFVSTECSNADDLLYDAFWFRHIDVPGFSICSKCFEFHIRNSVFQLDFNGKLEPGKTDAARCMFGVPRMVDQLWPEALSTHDLQSVKMYMEARSKIPNCSGVGGVSGQALVRLKWYHARHDAIPGFVACEACYHAFIAGSNFETRFTLHGVLPTQEQTWACDIAVPYLVRAYAQYSGSNDWPKFVAAAVNRLGTQPCAGMNVVSSTSRNWYGTKAGRIGLDVCETCYLDSVALTTLDRDFVSKPPRGAKETEVICDLAIPPLKAAHGAALGYEKHSIFWDTCSVQSKTPLCKGVGMTDVQWRTLRGGCDNFDVCPTCYSGFICAFGMQDHFELQKQSPPGTTKVCDFSVEAPRFANTMLRYSIAIATPDVQQFTSYVGRVASLSLCTGIKQQVSRFWRIRLKDDPMSVCPACYEDVLCDKPLTHYFHQEASPGKHLCDLYSANMRGRWRVVQEASAAQGVKDVEGNYLPDAGALAQFIAYREHRTEVFIQTVPEMDRLLAAAQNRLFQQRRLNMNSTFYTSLDMNTSNASGIHYGPTPAYTTTYGNSSVGYGFATPWGVEGAAYRQQAQAVAGQGGGDFARIAYLEARWKEVE